MVHCTRSSSTLATFDGDVNQGSFPNVRNEVTTPIALRAVWLDGGTLGGPQALYRGLPSASFGNPLVKNLIVGQPGQTTVPVSFTTDRCLYGDYRIGPFWFPTSGSYPGDGTTVKFDAPRDGQCYTSHGITFGVDTEPLQAGQTYRLTIRLEDPETGEVFHHSDRRSFPFQIQTIPTGLRCFGEQATIMGTLASDTIMGTPGRDVIRGLGGNDTIHGLGGDDIICGDSGNDVLLGGPGNDIALGAGGRDWISGGPGNDRLAGGLHADRILGNAGWDWIWGGNGGDRLLGGNGNDRLFGGAGNDNLIGGQGADRLNGGTGSNRLQQ